MGKLVELSCSSLALYDVAMHAEDAYLFRHALLRDAAYQTQLQGDRAKLHKEALGVMEEAFGEAPSPPTITPQGEVVCSPHPIDAHANAMSMHAQLAADHFIEDRQILSEREANYLWRDCIGAVQRHDMIRALGGFDRLSRHPGQSQALRLKALVELANHSVTCCDASIAYERCSDAIRQSTRLNSKFDLARSLTSRGWLQSSLGKVKEAEDDHLKALRLSSEISNDRLTARIQSHLGHLYAQTGRLKESAELHLESLDTSKRCSPDSEIASRLNNLAASYYQSGKLAESLAHYRESISLCRKKNLLRQLPVALQGAALVHLQHSDYSASQTALSEAMKLEQAIGSPLTLANLLITYSRLMQAMGRRNEAGQSLLKAADLYREEGAKGGLGIALYYLGGDALSSDNASGAIDLFREALMLLRESGNPFFEAGTLWHLADAYRQSGHSSDALEYYGQAINRFIDAERKDVSAEVHLELVRFLLDVGQTSRARDELTECVHRLRDLNMSRALRDRLEDLQDRFRQHGIDLLDGINLQH